MKEKTRNKLYLLSIILGTILFAQMINQDCVCAETYVDPDSSFQYEYQINEDGTIVVNDITMCGSNDSKTLKLLGSIDGKSVREIHLQPVWWKDGLHNKILDLSDCQSLQKLDCDGLVGNVKWDTVPSQLKQLELALSKGTVGKMGWNSLPAGIEELSVSALGSTGGDGFGYPENIELTTINLENYSNLRVFCCRGFYIERLSLKGLEKLERIECKPLETVDDRDLVGVVQSIDVSGCNHLKVLECNDVFLEKLNVDGCERLEELNCRSNLEYDNDYESWYNCLTELDLKSCWNLKTLNCEGNRIRKIDLSKCKELICLKCSYNCLETLNLKNNKKLKELYCNNNNLQKVVLPQKVKVKGNCKHNFLKRKPTLEMIKRLGKKNVIPQDKIASKNALHTSMFCIGDVKGIEVCFRSGFWFDSDYGGHVSRFQTQIKRAGAKKWKTYNNSLEHRQSIRNLRSGKKYLVRARAQFKVGKKWYSGKWSEIESVDVQ